MKIDCGRGASPGQQNLGATVPSSSLPGHSELGVCCVQLLGFLCMRNKPLLVELVDLLVRLPTLTSLTNINFRVHFSNFCHPLQSPGFHGGILIIIDIEL